MNYEIMPRWLRMIAAQFILAEYSDEDEFWSNQQKGVEPHEGLQAVHYGFTSGLIAKAFCESSHTPHRVLDIGSGTGRWLEWYTKEYGATVTGIEISQQMAEALSGRKFEVHCGEATEVLHSMDGRFDTINAISVMHHVLPESRRVALVHAMKAHLTPKGILVIGGYFLPWQVQYTTNRVVTKRCWSVGKWRRVLGVSCRVYANPACRWRGCPQNNILIAGGGI